MLSPQELAALQEIELRGLEEALSEPGFEGPPLERNFFFPSIDPVGSTTELPPLDKHEALSSGARWQTCSKSNKGVQVYASDESSYEQRNTSDLIESLIHLSEGENCSSTLTEAAVGDSLSPERLAIARTHGINETTTQREGQTHPDEAFLTSIVDSDHSLQPTNPTTASNTRRERSAFLSSDDNYKHILSTQYCSNLPCAEDDYEKNEKDMRDEKSDLAQVSPYSSWSSWVNDEQRSKSTHPLTPAIIAHVHALRRRIESMPRRKLRESLASSITIEDVEPLMSINRDEVAGLLGIGVTTWKAFVHKTLGIARWPARGVKSLQSKENSLQSRLREAHQLNDITAAREIQSELAKLRIQRDADRARRRSLAEKRRQKVLTSN